MTKISPDANGLPDDGTEIVLDRIARPAWSAGATLALSMLSAIGIFVAQGIGVLPVLLYHFDDFKGKRAEELSASVKQIASEGLALSLSIYSGGIAAVFFAILWSHLRGWSWIDYLAIRGFSWRACWIGFAGLAMFLVITYPPGDVAEAGGADFMIRVYQTAVFLPLFSTALIVVAPVWEELFFRGFMHRGLAAAWGPTPAILFCSACWAMMHVQYELSVIALLFLVGVFFGFARQLSGSTVLAVLLHAAMNCVAFIETIVYVGSLPD